MKQRELTIGEIVMLNPQTTKNKMLAGCLMVISEPKAFGAQGYIQATGEKGEIGGQAYYRAGWEEMEETSGHAPFLIGSAAEAAFEKELGEFVEQ